MKKVLLVDTNLSSFPIYQTLLNNNFEVYVIGNNPSDYLAKISNNYINANYSDTEIMNDIIQKYSFDYIVPGCNDASYEACSKSERAFYGIESINNNTILNDKLRFRLLCQELELPAPHLLEETDNIQNSIIVKPVDSFSGKGITVLKKDQKKQINSAIDYAILNSRTSKYIIEEYIEGQLFSHSAFLINKKIVSDFIVKEDCIASSFAVDTSYVYNQLDYVLLTSIRDAIEKIAVKLQLNDGLIHTQLIIKEAQFYLIEITRRCPGDLYSILIQKSTGYDYATNYVSAFVPDVIVNNYNEEKNYILRHTITSEHEMFLRAIKFNHLFKIDEFYILDISGGYLSKAPKSRVGILFICSASYCHLNETYDLLKSRKAYNLLG